MATLSPRRRWQCVGGAEDHLSAMPDDVLLLILNRLDTRSALATAVLARRWARLPRQLSALDFMVTDILPPGYHESLALRRKNTALDDAIEGYARRAMARYIGAINNFLEADDEDDGSAPRRTKRLRLEFFDPEDPVYVDRLISTAVTWWGVEDLVAVVKPARRHRQVAYCFPHECLDGESLQGIRKLTLGGCLLPPLHEYGALTELVLQDIRQPMPTAAYESVFTGCPRLRSVHLRRCLGDNDHNTMAVDAPASELMELVVDRCSFLLIRLLAVPSLERLACSGRPVELTFGHVPRLAHVNLNFNVSYRDGWFMYDYTLEWLLGGSPAAMTDLAVRLTGSHRWVTTGHAGATSFPGLRRLLVADIPSTWDVSWPCLLLEAAPSLEALHVHVTRGEDTPVWEPPNYDIEWEASRFRHRHLKELVVVGFERTRRQAYLVRYAMKVCVALRRVVLVKGGRVEEKGLWGGWEVVRPRGEEEDDGSCPWSEEEKVAVGREIKYGRYFKHHGQLVFE